MYKYGSHVFLANSRLASFFATVAKGFSRRVQWWRINFWLDQNWKKLFLRNLKNSTSSLKWKVAMWQPCVSTCTCLLLSDLKLSYHKISEAESVGFARESSFIFFFVSSTFVRFRSGPCEAWPFEVQEFPRIWLSRYTDTTLVTVISNNIRHLSRSSSTNKYNRCMLV